MGRRFVARTHRPVRRGPLLSGVVVALLTGLLAGPLVPPASAAAEAGLTVIVREGSDTDQVVDAPVTVYDDAGSEVATGWTDFLGEAWFLLEPGTYYVGTAPDGYDAEFYEDSPDLDGATPITLASDDEETRLMYVGGGAEPVLVGDVTGPDGSPVSGADVTVYEYDADFEEWWSTDWATTDADGHYEFSHLTAGTYRVGFEATGLVPEFYDDAPDVASADDVAVVEGSVAVRDARLAEAQQLRGTVSGPGGPLEDAEATLYTWDEDWEEWSSTDWAYTDDQGRYAFDVSGGDYRVGFSADGHEQEYWDDQPTVEEADTITVTSSSVTADAALALTKQISGTVRVGTSPVADVDVVAQRLVDDPDGAWWDDVSRASTGPDGSYRLDVPSGDYRVEFDDGTHLREWWQDAHTEDAADLVQVRASGVSGIDATLDDGGTVSGTVTATTGGAVAGAEATVYRYDAGDDYWEWVGSDTTDATGAYAVGGLLGGTYRVGFAAPGYLEEFHADAGRVEEGDDVAVTTGSTTDVDAALDRAGVITGTVSGPGVTQANLDVSLWERDRFTRSGWSRTFDTASKTGTTYRFDDLEPGTYRVRAAAPGLAPEFYLDDYEVGTADDVLAARNTTSTANLTLAPATTVSGTVTSAVGAAALQGASVLVQRKAAGTDGRFWDDYATATTDAAGGWTATVPPGTYRVRFGHADHVTEWHDGSATPSRATQLAVGSSAVDVDAVLDRLGRISGTVTGPSGVVAGATVTVWRYDNLFGDGAFRQVRSVPTGGTGTYTVTGLTPGSYRVGVRATGLQGEFFPDAQDVEHAGDVAVELNQTRTGTSVLLAPAARQLSGTVTGAAPAGPTPLVGADVVVSRRVVRLDDVVSWRDVAELQTGAGGTWSLSVAPGDYRIRFSDGAWVDEYYDDAATAQDAAVVTVGDADRTGLDALLAPGGRIAGTVTDAATGAALGGAEVYAFMPTGDDDEYVVAGDDGRFSLDGLTPGDWVVQYDADGHVREYYDDQPTQADADRIAVTVGGSTTADAALSAATPVSGTVTGSDGAPLGSVGVDLHQVLPGGEVDHFVESAFTAPDGTWSALLPAGTYLVQFEGHGDHLGEWYDDRSSEQTATPLVVGAAPVTGVDARLALGGRVAGTVTGPGGAVEPDAYVSVYRADATSELDSVWEGFADDDGRYRSDPLPAGSYKVRFETFDGSRLPEYHLDKATLATATAVAVAAGGTTTVDARLAAYPRLISGTVQDAQGRGLDGVDVDLYRRSGETWTWERDAATDADGQYRLPVVAGDYRISFSESDNRIAEWWDDARTLAAATTVTVGATDRTGIDATLSDGGVVTGTVTYPQQVTGWSSSVTLYDATSGAFAGQARVDAHQNRYRIEDLPTGTYRAEFSRSGGFDTAEAQFWNGRAEHLGKGTQTFAVTQGATTPNIGATLADGGVLTGVVRNGQGRPLEGCRVSAYTPDGSLVLRQSRYTGPDGTFRVRGLTTGSYRLRVLDGDCGFTTMYYDGVGQLTTDAAQAVGVAATRAASTAVAQPLVVPRSGSVANTSLPTVSDTTPEVGQVLSAGTGSWSQSGLSFTYQWLADGVAVPGAVAATWTVGAEQVGKTVSVRVTASKPDYVDGVATSAATAAVVSSAPPLTSSAPPTISDTTPEVGQALTSTTGTWSQTGVTFARQWTADGVDIPGATGADYTVAAADEGKLLRVKVTASKAGFSPGTATSSPTSAVVKPSITNTALPTVSDTTPEVGQELTAGEGTWSQSGLTFGYRWFRGATAIPGATARTYTPVTADTGQRLRVEVSASKPGFTTGTAESPQTEPVRDPSAVVVNTVLPAVTGTAAVGQALTTTGGTWTPGDATLAYQWLRGSTPIPGATGPSYTPVAGDVGTTLAVRVTGTKPGHTSQTVTSAATAAVVPGTIVASVPKVSGTAKVGKKLTAKPGTTTPATAKLKYQWLRNGKAIRGATKATYKLVKGDKGKKISVKVTRTAAGYTTLVQKSAQTRAVKG